MVAFSKQIVALATALAVVQALPTSFQFSSVNPAWATKRALFNLDKVSDDGQKEKLTQGLKDAVAVAAKTLDKMDDDKHKDKLEFWFGKENSDDNARESVKQVFKNFIGDDGDETGSDDTGKVSVDSTDFWHPKGTFPDGTVADGKTPFCSIEKDGKTGGAYFINNKSKTKPRMHFCDKVFSRTDLKSLTADDCSLLGDRISTVKWTKNFIGANVLHEYMHYDKIGFEVYGQDITDHAYDAYNCHALATNDKEEERKKTLLNADTYVWYALDIAFTEMCDKDFSEPQDESEDSLPDDIEGDDDGEGSGSDSESESDKE